MPWSHCLQTLQLRSSLHLTCRTPMNSSELLEPHRLLKPARIARTRPEELSEEFSTEACSTLPSPLCDQARKTGHLQPAKTKLQESSSIQTRLFTEKQKKLTSSPVPSFSKASCLSSNVFSVIFYYARNNKIRRAMRMTSLSESIFRFFKFD